MNITLANHYGMCFGVRDALRATHDAATDTPITVLGELVHNRVVRDHLKTLGVVEGDLESASKADTDTVVITAHGASDAARKTWADRGHQVVDTTCPLVRKAHKALAGLVLAGYAPVVIGSPDHVEVKGLVGDFPGTFILNEPSEVLQLPFSEKIGIVSQTTQPISRVRTMVELIEARHNSADVRFVDTVCQPTKDRQRALEELCAQNEIVVVVGGHNSNNTNQLAQKAESLGAQAHHVERPDDLDPKWFRGVDNVGVTAGTSTLDESVKAVVARLEQIAASQRRLFSIGA